MSPEKNEAPKGIVNRPAGYQKEVTAAGFDKNLLHHSLVNRIADFIRKYQNIIVFIVLGVCLVLGLLWWRSSRAQKIADQAFYETEKAGTAEALNDVLKKYGTSAAAPFIHYKLANLYMDDNKNEEAQKEYELILKTYPAHQVAAWTRQRLEQLKANEDWKKNSGQIAADLIKKRNLPHLTVKTTKGVFEVELYEDEAPNTVANFMNLVEKGFYNNLGIYETNFRIGSIFGNNPNDKPDEYAIPFESNHLKHVKGTMAMWRDISPDTRGNNPEEQVLLNPSGTRFYVYNTSLPIDENATGGLNGRYPIFGKVIQGMEVVSAMTAADKITSIVVDYKRNHEYKAKTLAVEKPKPVELFPSITPTPLAPVKEISPPQETR